MTLDSSFLASFGIGFHSVEPSEMSPSFSASPSSIFKEEIYFTLLKPLSGFNPSFFKLLPASEECHPS
jgi:hypothetical protein